MAAEIWITAKLTWNTASYSGFFSDPPIKMAAKFKKLLKAFFLIDVKKDIDVRLFTIFRCF